MYRPLPLMTYKKGTYTHSPRTGLLLSTMQAMPRLVGMVPVVLARVAVWGVQGAPPGPPRHNHQYTDINPRGRQDDTWGRSPSHRTSPHHTTPHRTNTAPR
ncbi:hypothetical protein ACOMHN_001371 [Nucella lapillus]